MSRSPQVLDLVKLRAKAGGTATMASRLSALGKPITPSGIRMWRRIPADRVAHVAEITGISKSVLRPDVFRPNVRKPRLRP